MSESCALGIMSTFQLLNGDHLSEPFDKLLNCVLVKVHIRRYRANRSQHSASIWFLYLHYKHFNIAILRKFHYLTLYKCTNIYIYKTQFVALETEKCQKNDTRQLFQSMASRSCILKQNCFNDILRVTKRIRNF